MVPHPLIFFNHTVSVKNFQDLRHASIISQSKVFVRSLYVCTGAVHVPCLSRLESPGDRGMAGAGLTGFRPNLNGTWPRRSFIKYSV